MLKLSGLKVHGLEPMSFELQAGEVLVVRGPSGSGKSLLLRAIADLDEAAGALTLNGQMRDEVPAEEWRHKVRYLAAESGWWLERVSEHFKHLNTAKPLAHELGLAAKLFDSPVAHLSSGERQRMSFIRALEDNPVVLLLDEPTSALDEDAAELMENKIRALQKQGVILIIVTHSNAQAKRLATRTLTIKDGATRIETA